MELQPTWERAFRVWRAIAWRIALAFLITIFVVMLSLGWVMVKMGLPGTVVDPVIKVAGLVFLTAASIWAVRSVLDRRFGDFRLVLVDAGQQVDTKK